MTNDATDTTPPAVTGLSVNGAALTVTFTEDIDPAHKGDWRVVVDGVVDTIAAKGEISANVLTLPLATPVVHGQVVRIIFDGLVARIQDLAGNGMRAWDAVRDVTNDTPVDTTAPAFSSAAVNGTALTVTFGEVLDTGSAPAGSAFSVRATPSRSGDAQTIAGTETVAISGATATVTLASAVAGGETVTVSYAKPNTNPLQDLSGNDAANFTNQSVTNNTTDTTPPAVTGLSVNGAALTVTFTEDIDPAHKGDWRVVVDGVVDTIAAKGEISANVLTLPLATPVVHGQVVRIIFDGLVARIQDLAGNGMRAWDAVRDVTNDTPVDTTAPAFSSAAVNGTALTVTFGEVLDTGSAPAGGAFSVSASESGTLAGTGTVAISGATATVTLASAVAAGETVTVSYTKPDTNPLRDEVGNDAAGFSNEAAYNVTGDRTAPAFSSASVNGAALTVTFDEALAPWSAPSGSAFSVSASESGTLAGTGTVAISGATATVTLASAVAFGKTATVSYTSPKPGANPLRDAGSNNVVSFIGKSVTNVNRDTTAPSFVSATANGDTVVFTFDEALDSTSPVERRAFQRTVGDASPGNRVYSLATTIQVSGRTVTATYVKLGFQPGPATHGQTVRVRYQQPTDQTMRLKDLSGNEAPEFEALATNNTPPAFESASVDGDTLTVTFNGDLDEDSVPAAGAFTVKATRGGTERDVALAAANPVAVSGSAVTLTLAAAVRSAAIDTVTVAYGGTKLRDAGNAMHPVPVFTAQSVTNNTPAETTPPRLSRIRVDGNTLEVVWNEELLEDLDAPDRGKPPGSAFTVRATKDGSARSIAGTMTRAFAQSNRGVTVRLGDAVVAGETLTVSYAKPASNPIRDLVGNEAPAFSNEVAYNITGDTTGARLLQRVGERDGADGDLQRGAGPLARRDRGERVQRERAALGRFFVPDHRRHRQGAHPRRDGHRDGDPGERGRRLRDGDGELHEAGRQPAAGRGQQQRGVLHREVGDQRQQRHHGAGLRLGDGERGYGGLHLRRGPGRERGGAGEGRLHGRGRRDRGGAGGQRRGRR